MLRRMLCGRGFDIGALAGFKAVAEVALISGQSLYRTVLLVYHVYRSCRKKAPQAQIND